MKLSILAPALAGALVAGIALAAAAAPREGGVLGALREQGEGVFTQHCAKCHDPAAGRAPDKAALAQRSPEEVIGSLKAGKMAPMAVGLGDADIAAVALYLTGRLPGQRPAPQAADPPPCAAKTAFSPSGPDWNGWGANGANWRLQRDPGVARADIARLKVKWAMTYMGGRYGQPTIVGGRLFLTSAGGRIYSLDAATGCLIWRYDVAGGARTSMVIGPLKRAPSGYAAYFGDLQRNVYALDAASGALIWKLNVDTHPLSVITGSPALYQDRLYVPLSSYEEATGTLASYGCCTFRGAVTAVDAASGKLVWKAFAISQAPHPTRKNSAGTQMFGPAGAAIWSAPTVDPKRRLVYVATGDSYTDEAQDGSDAVIAIEMATGKIRWRRQMTQGDNYLMGCEGQRSGANCPTTLGPDHDFGASPILAKAGGRDIVLAGQKSGMVYGLDPDDGHVLWASRVGAGGPLGGVEWGMAFDGARLYVANADPFAFGGVARPGLYALGPADGKQAWAAPAPKVACGFVGRCFNAQSAAPTAVPGAVLSTTTDGRLRAYDASDGKILWEFDTAGQTYATINGVKDQTGGSLDATGPTLAGGMVFLISGYQGPMGGVANNVLLAFSVDGK